MEQTKREPHAGDLWKGKDDYLWISVVHGAEQIETLDTNGYWVLRNREELDERTNGMELVYAAE